MHYPLPVSNKKVSDMWIRARPPQVEMPLRRFVSQGQYIQLDGVRDIVVLQLPDQFRKCSVQFMVVILERRLVSIVCTMPSMSLACCRSTGVLSLELRLLHCTLRTRSNTGRPIGSILVANSCTHPGWYQGLLLGSCHLTVWWFFPYMAYNCN